VEFLTGRIPLLLRALFDITKFDEETFLGSMYLKKVEADISVYFTAKMRELKDYPREKNE
jgi:hypothetical protein